MAYINRARHIIESDVELGDKVYDRHTIIDLMGFRIKTFTREPRIDLMKPSLLTEQAFLMHLYQ
ncbi:hypothetical protein [Morganella morganii]|uniref:hypothetical protein n=1 Tax=Morganella morganii TaxID=582 RepID=UPI00339BA5A9